MSFGGGAILRQAGAALPGLLRLLLIRRIKCFGFAEPAAKWRKDVHGGFTQGAQAEGLRQLKHVVRFILLFLTIVGAASPAANRVSSATTDGVGRSFSYDARGNVTNDGRNTFYYNLTNQPVSVTGSVTAAYVYDANLKRVKEVRNGATVYTIYSRVTGGLVMRDDLGAGVKTDYASAGLANVRVKKTGAVFTPEFTHFDHQGSAVAATDAAGASLWTERYGAFGTERQNPAANDNDTAYTGHLKDDATGLTYMQARLYDPQIGRFYSTDPIGYDDQLNLYAYVHNDPVNGTDPTGEFFNPVSAIYGAIAGGVGGYVSTGTITGAVVGAAAGGVVGGLVQVPALAAAAGSAVGQVSAQAVDNVQNGRPIAANLSVDATAVAGAVVGNGIAKPIAGAVKAIAPVSRGAVIGSELGAETVGRTAGNTGASIVDGALTGAGELAGDKVGDAANRAGIPDTIQITDSDGNLDIRLTTDPCAEKGSC